jgi:hypothetical protein
MENEILMLMLIICLLIIYLYQNYVEKTSFILKEKLKIIDADEIDFKDKYKYNNIYRKNICLDKKEKNNKMYKEVKEVKKSPKSILKNKDTKQNKINKKVEIIDNNSYSIGDLINNSEDVKSLNSMENTLSDIESFIN